MYSPHRLDSPPPPSHFRRPWSPLELESYRQSAMQRQRREASDVSFEALDLADYARILPRDSADNMRLSMNDSHYPDYPSTPPRSFPLSRGDSRLTLPSLASGGSDSSHVPSPNFGPATPTYRPFSLPPPRISQPPVSPGPGRSVNYLWDAEHHNASDEAEVDISTFPEWSKDWYKNRRPRPRSNVLQAPYDPFQPYESTHFSPSHGSIYSPSQPQSVASDSHRNLLPWSADDDGHIVGIPPEVREERLKLLEKEFGSSSAKGDDWHDEIKVIGSVNADGNIITPGPKKRIAMRWAQGTFSLGAAMASLYSALLIKPVGTPPPRGTVPAYLLYFLSVISVLLIVYLFVLRPCCCPGKRKPGMVQDEVAGMAVLPVQGFPGAGKKKAKKGRGKHNDDSSVQVNLIVDPSMFGGLGSKNDKGDEEETGSAPEYNSKRRRGIFEGLAMERQWKLARKHLKRLLFFDIALFFLWAAEFVVILLGKRCPVGQFEGWCDGYNVATALASFLSLTFGFNLFFDVKDLHASKISPRSRT
ncbi:hypothetical protein M0805_003087 [Coniferiporia weirii]|nr:hypothetical protein M0805_003087 [Coniferiporia weirii]